DVLQIGEVPERVEETLFHGPWVSEDVRQPIRAQLFEDRVPARLDEPAVIRRQRRQDGSRCRTGERGICEAHRYIPLKMKAAGTFAAAAEACGEPRSVPATYWFTNRNASSRFRALPRAAGRIRATRLWSGS